MSKSSNPYQLLQSKAIYKNPWLELREDSVERPDGKHGIFGVVTIQSGVSVLPIDDEGNVYLIKEYQYAAGKPTVLTITGGIDPGEGPLEAAQRELKEEAGLQASEWIGLGSVESMMMVIDATMHLFLAQGLTVTERHADDIATIELLKMPLAEAVKLAMESKIGPAAPNVLVLRANEYLRSN